MQFRYDAPGLSDLEKETVPPSFDSATSLVMASLTLIGNTRNANNLVHCLLMYLERTGNKTSISTDAIGMCGLNVKGRDDGHAVRLWILKGLLCVVLTHDPVKVEDVSSTVVQGVWGRCFISTKITLAYNETRSFQNHLSLMCSGLMFCFKFRISIIASIDQEAIRSVMVTLVAVQRSTR